jgi:sec-independent protein translocase protein TatA
MFDRILSPEGIIVLLVIALLLFGPSKLPSLGKGLGEAFRGFKDGIKGGETDTTAKQENTAAKSDPVTPK